MKPIKSNWLSEEDVQLEMFGLGDVESGKKTTDETFLTAQPVVDIRVEPGKGKKRFRLRRTDFVQAKRKAYLLMGVDTEYQSLPFTQDDIKEGRAKNEILSYQAYLDDRKGTNCSVIAIPDTKQKLTLAEFVVFSLASLVQRGVKIPGTIVMPFHFSRADIPAFSEKDQWWTKLSNVRNSLVTGAVPVRLRIMFKPGDEENFVELKIYIADTKLLAPTGRQSLAQLGELLGLEKLKLADNAADELLLKKSMKALRDNNWPKFKEYALRDAEVSALYFEKIAAQYREVTGSDFIPAVLSSIGVRIQTNDWRERGLDPQLMVGRIRHQEESFSDKKGYIVRSKKTPYVEEFHWYAQFIAETYHGGRNEQMWFGPSLVDDWTDYDLTSAYPTAMARLHLPLWHETREMTEEEFENLDADTLAFANVEFSHPECVRYPVLPNRTRNGLIYPRRGRAYCSAPEIVLARALGCDLRLRRGVIIPVDKRQPVFFDFIKFAIEQRRAGQTEIEKQFWKELVNSCYGKTAQGLQEKRVFSLRSKRNKRLPESAITNPAFASFITSYVRAVCGEMMNAIPENKQIFSVTTDGFITNADASEMQQAVSGALSRNFQETVSALSGDPLLKVKHQARQLLGWRTRGQATVQPGLCEAPSNIVLAKAGIRPPGWATENHEQNDWIVDTFLKRTGATSVEMDVLTSMREMILYDADLVSKKVRRKHPMEYDFKRRPKAVGMINATLPKGRQISHVAFSTEPYETEEEFRLTRDIWDNYRRGQDFCIKTKADFLQFAEAIDRTRSLTEKKKGYLRASDRDGLQRFRRDLCDAFKNGNAGFEFHRHLSNHRFAELLNEVGGFKDSPAIVKVEHVENGKRRIFEPNATVPTRQVLAAMEKLKEVFPRLRAVEFLGAIPEGAAIWSEIAVRGLDQSPPSF
ncbi:MAG: DNA polymerase [Afipia sp.]|nr:DNA polymerase [Afipia sp.]